MLERHIDEPRRADNLVLVRDDQGIIGAEVPKKRADTGELFGYTSYITAPRALQVSDVDGAALHIAPVRWKAGSAVERRLQCEAADALIWDAREQLGDRELPQQKYFGLKARGARIANAAVREALLAGEQEALHIARRFPLAVRGRVYAAIAGKPRLKQFAEAFPVAACMLWSFHKDNNLEVRSAQLRVARGESAKAVARDLDLPFAMRRVPPSCATDAIRLRKAFKQEPRLLGHMPTSAPQIKRWLRAIDVACDIPSLEWVSWVARHHGAFGNRVADISANVRDVNDFIRSSYRRRAGQLPQETRELIAIGYNVNLDRADDNCIERPFHSDMAPTTVFELSHEWHEQVALVQAPSGDTKFPEPWIPAGREGGIDIEPITSAIDLHHEGRAMKHCVGTYRDSIRQGHNYIYSARKDGERVATVEITDVFDCIKLGQVRGKCNIQPDKKVQTAVTRWFNKNKASAQVPPKQGAKLHDPFADADAGIPF